MPSSVRVIKTDPYLSWEGSVQFRLIYVGKLLGASRNETRSSHKHDIRRLFHKQLKRLWSVNRHLVEIASHDRQDEDGVFMSGDNYLQYLSEKFAVGSYNCVPLVTSEMQMACGLDILFLRYDQPGATLIQSGDIDNRLKTLFDALRRPQNTAECPAPAGDDENPFFCLLEDDKLIDHVAVTTDLLLEPDRDVNDVHLVIDVKMKLTHINLANIGFMQV